MSKEVKRISAREGRAFLSGTQVTSMIKLNAVFTPEISKKRVIGQKGMTSKVVGYDITGTITQFKATQWLRTAIKTYIDTGVFPKFSIAAVLEDKDSDFYAAYGAEKITLLGVQIEGDLPVIDLDAEGEEIKEEIKFSASGIRFS